MQSVFGVFAWGSAGWTWGVLRCRNLNRLKQALNPENLCDLWSAAQTRPNPLMDALAAIDGLDDDSEGDVDNPLEIETRTQSQMVNEPKIPQNTETTLENIPQENQEEDQSKTGII